MIKFELLVEKTLRLTYSKSNKPNKKLNLTNLTKNMGVLWKTNLQ